VEEVEGIAEWYRWFATNEARGRSPLYEEFAGGVAGDREVLGVLVGLDPAKRQPNLLFAAVRHVCGVAGDWPEFRRWFLDRRDEVIAVMLARRTQTNEPARCATLLPLLAILPGPLALIEVGAAAGLCLLIDRYSYAYNGHTVPAREPSAPLVQAPLFRCAAGAGTPLPSENLDVVWRAGLDLNPLDVHDVEQMAWLETLVWPGEGRRLDLLRQAIEVARVDPPHVVRGDLRTDLARLAAQAPSDATLVVFHTAVLNYVVDVADRASFGDTVASLGARWIANEGAGVLNDATVVPAGRFLLSLDQRPIAWTDPHGTAIDWLPTTP
jgi:hypothetical protein